MVAWEKPSHPRQKPHTHTHKNLILVVLRALINVGSTLPNFGFTHRPNVPTLSFAPPGRSTGLTCRCGGRKKSGPAQDATRWKDTRSCLHMGMGQNQTTRGPQVLVHVSIYQGPILGYLFLTHTHMITTNITPACAMCCLFFFF